MSLDLAPDRARPDANDRQLILQQLLASWPFELLEDDDAEALDAFRGRMLGWVEKALREAKRRTSWTHPREDYEQAAKELIVAALLPGSPFLGAYRSLAREMARRGMVRGLSRTVLKLTLPGVPDIFQGAEFWDLSLVDPDNRRPVDYPARAEALAARGEIAGLLDSWEDGRIKQSLIAALLADRAALPLLYAEGDYQPLTFEGDRAPELIGFSRSHRSDTRLVLATRIVGSEALSQAPPIGEHWQGVSVPGASGPWEDLLTGQRLVGGPGGLAVSAVLSRLPIAVLRKG